MQTFLPFPDFARSARVLDRRRLGRQRVETLQVLRAATVPGYGWYRHPATAMWDGHVPALGAYGRAIVDEWTARGGADSTGWQIREFAPEAWDAWPERGVVQPPPWLGDDAGFSLELPPGGRVPRHELAAPARLQSPRPVFPVPSGPLGASR